MDRFRREQPGLHRKMRTLDLRAVQKTRVAADEHRAGRDELRQGLQTALRDRARAVRDPFASREHAADPRMRFPALKLGERIEMRIRVTERNHETGVNARL